MQFNKRAVAVIAIAGAVLIGVGTTGAVAGQLVTSHNIKDGTIRMKDFREPVADKIRANNTSTAGKDGTQGPKGDTGAPGAKGDTGSNGLLTAYYAEAFYNAGNTNSGAIATVACKATTDVAISGGVQVLGLDAGANARNTPVSSSFAGRMDWDTNAPRPGRLDGWIIQFGGNAGATSDKAPEKVKVYALCVPGASIAVENTYTQQ